MNQLVSTHEVGTSAASRALCNAAPCNLCLTSGADSMRGRPFVCMQVAIEEDKFQARVRVHSDGEPEVLAEYEDVCKSRT